MMKQTNIFLELGIFFHVDTRYNVTVKILLVHFMKIFQALH
jgi:hypothetical protein